MNISRTVSQEKQMESEDGDVAPSRRLFMRKQEEKKNRPTRGISFPICFAESEIGGGQKQNPVAVSAVRREYLGSAAPSEFLSPLSRITVSRNWKQREIQILTLQDICVTLATLN